MWSAVCLVAVLVAAPPNGKTKGLTVDDFPPTAYAGVEDETTRLYLEQRWRQHVDATLRQEARLKDELAALQRQQRAGRSESRLQRIKQLQASLKDQPARLARLKRNEPIYFPELVPVLFSPGRAGILKSRVKIMQVLGKDRALVRLEILDNSPAGLIDPSDPSNRSRPKDTLSKPFMLRGIDLKDKADGQYVDPGPTQVWVVREPETYETVGGSTSRVHVLEPFILPPAKAPADPRKPDSP